MYQFAHAAEAAPRTAATGKKSSRQSRDRHPIATSSTPTDTVWTTPGTQPCIKEVWLSASTANARFAGEPVTLSIVNFLLRIKHDFCSSDAAARAAGAQSWAGYRGFASGKGSVSRML